MPTGHAPVGIVTVAWPARLISQIDAADLRAKSLAGQLSCAQLNWSPTLGAWSIGQCLDHLRVGAEVYLPAIAAALNHRFGQAVEEIHLGWISRRFIRAFIAPNPGGTRAKAPVQARPAQSVDPSVLDRYLATNQKTRELIQRASNYDVNRIRFRNPFISWIRFTVGTGFEIIVQHQARHLLQAEGVRHSPDFPL
jgi:hypothetical protein